MITILLVAGSSAAIGAVGVAVAVPGTLLLPDSHIGLLQFVMKRSLITEFSLCFLQFFEEGNR